MPRSVPFTVSPAHRERLASSGLATLGECRAFTGGFVVKALVPGRETVRIDAGECTYYLKRVAGPMAGEIVNEAHVLGVLRELGLPVAEVAAVGAASDFAALVMVAMPVRGTLERELLDEGPAPARVSRRSRQVAAILRALHRAGVQHRDFYLTHLLVGQADDLYVADFGRARFSPRLGWMRRIKDLAALDYSTPARVASDWARLRFLRAYTGPLPRWRFRILAALLRSRARAMRRHVERRVAQSEANYHVPA